MSDRERRTAFCFGQFRLDAGERTLFDGVRSISLAPKVFDTLLLLVENQGKVLSKERMLREIWEDSFVEENNLAQNISLIRKTLGETKNSRFIETVPKFGYRFVAPVHTADKPKFETEVTETTRAQIYVTGQEIQTPLSAPKPSLKAITPETQYVQN